MTLTPYWSWLNRTVALYRPVLGPISGDRVIVGYAKNYRLADLQALIASFEQNVAAPMILICVLPDAEKAVAEEKGIQIVSPSDLEGWRPFPAFERILETLSVLKALPETIDRVVWCDTRDLVFQRDPFLSELEADIVLCSEGNSPALGKTATGRWLARALGEDAVKPIADKLMANCGVVCARRDALERLLHIVAILGGVSRHRLSRLRAFCLDQALFNYAAHYQLAGSTLVIPNLGRVANLCDVDGDSIPIRDGLLCAPDTEEPFEIVHMFDRVPKMAAWARDQYGWPVPERRRSSKVSMFAQKLKASLIKRTPEIRF